MRSESYSKLALAAAHLFELARYSCADDREVGCHPDVPREDCGWPQMFPFFCAFQLVGLRRGVAASSLRRPMVARSGRNITHPL